jgi:hypothetical protein
MDDLVGLFDCLVEPGQEVDVTQWVKSLRKRSF